MKSALALSTAALLATVYAQDPITTGEYAGDVSSDDWDSVVESPDLSATQSFTGRDVTSAYPGESQSDWEVKMAVKEELKNPTDQPGDYIVGTTLSLVSPDGDDVEMDDSWKLCTHVYPIKSSGETEWGAEFDSTCQGIVAPECTDDLKKKARSAFKKGNCDSWQITPSCIRDLAGGKGNSTTIDSDTAGSLLGANNTFYRRAGEIHSGDDEEHTALMNSVTSPFAVVNVFGSADNADDEVFVEVRCLLPDTVAEGAYDPTPDSATSVGKFFGWTALTGAVAFQFLL